MNVEVNLPCCLFSFCYRQYLLLWVMNRSWQIFLFSTMSECKKNNIFGFVNDQSEKNNENFSLIPPLFTNWYTCVFESKYIF